MKMKLLGGLLAATTITAMGVAVAPIIGNNVQALTRTNNIYSCNDIVFSETVDNPGKYADISDVSNIAITSLDCSMTNWTNANYGDKGTTAIKLGGSKSGKYAGSVKLTLNGGMTATKVIVYSTGWSGDTGDIQLGVNGSYQSITNTIDSYVFTPYTFTFTETNEIIFSNNANASGKRRLVISKIVLRLYGEQSGSESSGGEDPTPVDPPTPSSDPIDVSSTIQKYAANNNWNDATKYTEIQLDSNITISVNGGGNTGKYYTNGQNWRLYQGEGASITATAVSGYTIISIVYTYVISNTGTLKDGNTVIESGSTVNVNDSNKTLAVGNTGSATNGQVRITEIKVTYTSNN